MFDRERAKLFLCMVSCKQGVLVGFGVCGNASVWKMLFVLSTSPLMNVPAHSGGSTVYCSFRLRALQKHLHVLHVLFHCLSMEPKVCLLHCHQDLLLLGSCKDLSLAYQHFTQSHCTLEGVSEYPSRLFWQVLFIYSIATKACCEDEDKTAVVWQSLGTILTKNSCVESKRQEGQFW